MYRSHEIGKKGEEIAEKYLIETGYQIIDKNFSCRQGEIDIIAKEKEEIVFVEVKTRSNNKYGEPVESITYWKKKHMIKSIQYYLFLKGEENSYIRVDVIEVYSKRGEFYINHIKNVMN